MDLQPRGASVRIADQQVGGEGGDVKDHMSKGPDGGKPCSQKP